MTPEEHARVKEIFLAAVARALPARAAFLDEACGANAGLRREVENLLRHASERQPEPGADATVTSPAAAPRGGRTRVIPPDVLTREESPGSARQRTFAPGTVIADRYRIIALLGKGGMGEVYRADDLTLDQAVAVKFLAAEFASDPSWLARFHQEVRVARQVTHPNVCRVYDIGASGDDSFISMEYVDGENLSALLRRIGRLPQDKALDIAQQLCAGLAAAHARGVLHRDLKPANVMLDSEGRVRITDFGLAATRANIAHTELRAGTPAYMSPEQLAGRDVSIRSDLYALGLTLYELFTGRPAFHADNAAELMRMQQDSRPTAPSTLIRDLDPAVERIILQCLEADPSKRPASALAVASGLPGGDILAVALAAGETPPPAMVAAAGARSGISTRIAAIGLAGFVVLAAVSVLYPQSHATMTWAGLGTSPAILVERARAVATACGYDATGAGTAYGFADDVQTTLGSVRSQDGDTVTSRYALPTGIAALFWYRQSSTVMQPAEASNLVFGPWRVTPTDPPAAQPGALTVALDAAGGLLGFEAVSDLYDVSPLADTPVDWGPLWAAAGLDKASLQPIDPRITPRVYADTRVAWRGHRRDAPATPVRVEAAAYRGQPVLFLVLNMQDAPDDGPAWLSLGRRRTAVSNAYHILLTVLILTALPLAKRSLRHERSDPRGAWRLAGFAFAARMTIWVLQADHAGVFFVELRYLALVGVGALGEAALVWLFYVALEPYVRKFWPQTLIAWNRVLTGRFADPLVGRNILVGAVFGAWIALLPRLDFLLARWLDLPVRETWRARDPYAALLGGRQALAGVIDLLRDAVYQGLFFLLLIALLRALLRKPMLGSAAATLLIAALYVPRGSHPLVSWPVLGLGGVAVAVWVLTRFGLMPLVTASFVSGLLFGFPFDFSAWYGDISLFAAGVACATALLGFVAARRGRTDIPIRRLSPSGSA